MTSETRPVVRLMPLLLLLAGCGSTGGPAQYGTSIQVEAPESAGNGSDELPPLPVSILEDPVSSEQLIQRIEVVDQDLRLVVQNLAESFGLNYQLDPEVSGRVTTRLRDVTLETALNSIVLPHGFTYSIQGNVLRVMPAELATRIFSLDYMSMSRIGVGTTVIQRRLGSPGGGGLGTGQGAGGFGNLGGGAAGGADIIQSVTVADLWEEMRISLEGLIFDSSGQAESGEGTGTAGGAGAGGGQARAPGAYSRVAPDGRRLLINPLAGTIMVSAPAETMQEVAALLDAIEGSVHRQVLIEARIVEIGLNQNFQFGVDWSAIQNLGDVDIRLGVGQSGAQLTIGGDGDADQQIGMVLEALESQGQVNVLSAPRVSVLNNQRATINVATDEVFFAVTRQPVIGPNGTTIGFDTQIQPQQIAVGIVLDVHPQISSDNTITMNIRPVITDVVEVREVRLEDGTQASAPVIDRRETDTVVRVRDGETIVIGGLMRTMRRTDESGVPFLSRIPLLGRIFGGYSEETDKRELVIFITPTIIAGPPPIAR